MAALLAGVAYQVVRWRQKKPVTVHLSLFPRPQGRSARLLDAPVDIFTLKGLLEVNSEVDAALERAYKEKCALNNLFCQRVDRVANLVRWWDLEWFERWVEEHRPPIQPGAGEQNPDA
jgi:hypothetical protein